MNKNKKGKDNMLIGLISENVIFRYWRWYFMTSTKPKGLRSQNKWPPISLHTETFNIVFFIKNDIGFMLFNIKIGSLDISCFYIVLNILSVILF